MKNVDIIIPIYNGLDDLKKCLTSIKKHTNLKENRVIMVNDKSPDERVLEYLLTQQGENMILIDSPVNEGFSASVNKGICYSDRDVILLNSDTVVTAGWVEKIVRCAYSDSMIGTVTPLSNSATLCSVPIICQDNDIPEGRTIEEYAEIIEKCSLQKYPEITVAVGFCMHIKREVINRVGLFDGKTFERGYGEENDFCNRAILLGYKHVLCDDTLVYHKGTVSFVNEEKQRLIDSHNKILEEWYPYLMRKNHLYCMNNPDQYIRDNVEIWNGVMNKKSNLLLMVQSDFREDASDHRGGTQYHVKDLVEGLKKEYNVFVVARDLEFLRLTIYDEEKKLSFKFYIGPADEHPQIHDMRLKRVLRQIMEGFAISMIHVHHVYNLSFDIFDLAKELNIPYVITVHDFYYICPVIKLNNCKGTICDQTCETELCAECLREKRGIVARVDFVKQWREIVNYALKEAKQIIFPSMEAKNIFTVYYPDSKEKYQVIEHGLDKFISEEVNLPIEKFEVVPNIEFHFDHVLENSFLITGWAFMYEKNCNEVNTYLYIKDAKGKNVFVPCQKMERPDVADIYGNVYYTAAGFAADTLGLCIAPGRFEAWVVVESEGKYYQSTKMLEGVCNKKVPDDTKLNVAFLGGLVPEKGSGYAYELIRKFKKDINWYIIGGMNDEKLKNLEQENLTKFGEYEREDTYRILKEYDIDILCILPTWPETFCYTLSEAWLAGIPAICTSIGALTERFQKDAGGWSFDLSDHLIEDIEKLLKELCSQPKLVDDMKQIVKAIDKKSVGAMTKEYIALYQKFQDHRQITTCQHKEEFVEAFRLEKNRYYGDMGIVAEQTLARTAAEISGHYHKEILDRQEKYNQVVQDYGNTMKRLDRIREMGLYKVYSKLKRKK